MPFIIIQSQKSLSDLLRIYQTEVEHWSRACANTDYPTATQACYQGYVYVLASAIESLSGTLGDAEFTQNLREQYQRCLEEWQAEETRESYQLGRIRMLTTVVTNLGDLESYEEEKKVCWSPSTPMGRGSPLRKPSGQNG